jgi:DNA-binding PadR family transcriptional regulator
MTATRVLVLGVLMPGEPLHGYEVRKRLELMGVQNWANVGFGSVYHALTAMTKDGLLEVAGPGEGDDRERVRYRITQAGRADFRRRLDRTWREIQPIVDPFLIALTFIEEVPAAELQALMAERQDRLRAGFVMTERVLAAHSGPGTPASVDESLRLTAAQYRAQLDWLDDAAQRLRKDGRL